DLQALLNNLFDGASGSTGSSGKTITDVLTALQNLFDSAGLKLAKARALQTLINNIVDGATGSSGSSGQTPSNALSALQSQFTTLGSKLDPTSDLDSANLTNVTNIPHIGVARIIDNATDNIQDFF